MQHYLLLIPDTDHFRSRLCEEHYNGAVAWLKQQLLRWLIAQNETTILCSLGSRRREGLFPLGSNWAYSRKRGSLRNASAGLRHLIDFAFEKHVLKAMVPFRFELLEHKDTLQPIVYELTEWLTVERKLRKENNAKKARYEAHPTLDERTKLLGSSTLDAVTIESGVKALRRMVSDSQVHCLCYTEIFSSAISRSQIPHPVWTV